MFGNTVGRTINGGTPRKPAISPDEMTGAELRLSLIK